LIKYVLKLFIEKTSLCVPNIAKNLISEMLLLPSTPEVDFLRYLLK